MGSYAYTLAVAAMFCAIIMLLSRGADGKPARLVAFIGALTMIAVMVSPIPRLFSKELSFSTDIYQEEVESEKSTAQYYATSAGEALCTLYSEKPENVSAQVVCSDDGSIVKLTLTVKGSTYYDKKEASKVLSEIYGIDIEVREGEN